MEFRLAFTTRDVRQDSTIDMIDKGYVSHGGEDYLKEIAFRGDGLTATPVFFRRLIGLLSVVTVELGESVQGRVVQRDLLRSSNLNSDAGRFSVPIVQDSLFEAEIRSL